MKICGEDFPNGEGEWGSGRPGPLVGHVGVNIVLCVWARGTGEGGPMAIRLALYLPNPRCRNSGPSFCKALLAGLLALLGGSEGGWDSGRQPPPPPPPKALSNFPPSPAGRDGSDDPGRWRPSNPRFKPSWSQNGFRESPGDPLRRGQLDPSGQ